MAYPVAMTNINWKRWLPTSAPLISGAIASGLVLVLRKLGIVVLPQEISSAVTPAVAFLAAAIVHKPSVAQVTTLVNTEEHTTIGKLLVGKLETEIDSNPEILDAILGTVLPLVTPQRTLPHLGSEYSDLPETMKTYKSRPDAVDDQGHLTSL